MSDAFETLRALENKLDSDAKERQEQLPKLRLRLKTLLQRLQEKHKLMAEQVAPGSQPHLDFNNIELTLANVNRFIGSSANLAELLYLKQLMEDYLRAAEEAALAEVKGIKHQQYLSTLNRFIRSIKELAEKNPLDALLSGNMLSQRAMDKLKADIPKMSPADKQRLEHVLREHPLLRERLAPALSNRPRLVMY